MTKILLRFSTIIILLYSFLFADIEVGVSSFKFDHYFSGPEYHLYWYPLKYKKWGIGFMGSFLDHISQPSTTLKQNARFLSVKFLFDLDQPKSVFVNYNKGRGSFSIENDSLFGDESLYLIEEGVVGYQINNSAKNSIQIGYLRGKIFTDSLINEYEGVFFGYRVLFNISQEKEKVSVQTNPVDKKTRVEELEMYTVLQKKLEDKINQNPKDIKSKKELALLKQKITSLN